MKDIVDILKEIGDLAHWTLRPAPEACGGRHACPPIITWRYKHPSDELADFFRRVVGAFAGTISWEFSATHEVWSLMPSRIREYSKSHGDVGGLAVAKQFMEMEPDFGIRANAELPLLAAFIQRHRGAIECHAEMK